MSSFIYIFIFFGRSLKKAFKILSKEIIRGSILKHRRQLSEDVVREKSISVVNNLKNSFFYNNSRNIALYYPFRNEVDLLALLSEKDKNFYFPKVVGTSRKLSFYKVSDISQFVKGAFGIMEPDENLDALDIEKIDLFIVPGVAFSEKGERIGYGGGYYDATLMFRRESSFAVGAAFDFQIVSSGFSEAHDRFVDGIVTESQTLLIRTKE